MWKTHLFWNCFVEYDRFTRVRHFKIKITTHLLKIKKATKRKFNNRKETAFGRYEEKKIKNASN